MAKKSKIEIKGSLWGISFLSDSEFFKKHPEYNKDTHAVTETIDKYIDFRSNLLWITLGICKFRL